MLRGLHRGLRNNPPDGDSHIWRPTYWLSGIVKAITAFVSVTTAVLLIRLIPQALALPSPEQLRKSNAALQNEIKQRIHAAEKIESLNRELLAQTTKIEAVNRELEAFSYSVSHDLRSPLRHIDGYVGLLGEKAASLGEEGARYMKKIADSSKQMGLLIDNLLAFSRMGRSALQMGWTDAGKVVEEVRDELAPDINGRAIEWKIAALPRFMSIAALFKQVWINLLGNAVKYTRHRDHAQISVGCTENPTEYEFEIKDNGAGFDMQYADKLFGVFQRLHFTEELKGSALDSLM